jgi:hypothetical protein
MIVYPEELLAARVKELEDRLRDILDALHDLGNDPEDRRKAMMAVSNAIEAGRPYLGKAEQ